ncbi:MAG: hypothetical protein AAFR66_16045, partial [Bacteroidota bacterium]
LLEGMKGPGLRERQFVDVDRLFIHAKTRVPNLADNIGLEQSPKTFSPPGSGSFEFGKVTEDVKSKIELSSPKPILILDRIGDDNDKFKRDTEKFTARVEASLEEEANKGKNAKLSFLGKNLEGGENIYHLLGLYKNIDGTYELNAGLMKNEEEVAEFTVSDTDLQALAKKLTMAIVQHKNFQP